ncbi:jg8004 [Pararge aegeria aegeria]|uniref:Jg8004 protein n=1 Tax=Pararge aegeria aegeria TaxID=348720 RepID=A0A8S4RH21_9NEOP|nr:jg8004 [Pararge aegeria aegeria]
MVTRRVSGRALASQWGQGPATPLRSVRAALPALLASLCEAITLNFNDYTSRLAPWAATLLSEPKGVSSIPTTGKCLCDEDECFSVTGPLSLYYNQIIREWSAGSPLSGVGPWAAAGGPGLRTLLYEAPPPSLPEALGLA